MRQMDDTREANASMAHLSASAMMPAHHTLSLYRPEKREQLADETRFMPRFSPKKKNTSTGLESFMDLVGRSSYNQDKKLDKCSDVSSGQVT